MLSNRVRDQASSRCESNRDTLNKRRTTTHNHTEKPFNRYLPSIRCQPDIHCGRRAATPAPTGPRRAFSARHRRIGTGPPLDPQGTARATAGVSLSSEEAHESPLFQGDSDLRAALFTRPPGRSGARRPAAPTHRGTAGATCAWGPATPPLTRRRTGIEARQNCMFLQRAALRADVPDRARSHPLGRHLDRAGHASRSTC